MLSGIWMGITSLFRGGPRLVRQFTGARMTHKFGTMLSEPGLITYLKMAPNNLSVTVLLTLVFLQAVAELDLAMCTLHGA